MERLLQWLPVNDDVEAELHYWVGQLRSALGLALAFAVATGVGIAVLPGEVGGGDGYAFLKEYWTYVTEAAFWLGMLSGLLWGAGKRFGSALAGSLPWHKAEECSEGEVQGRCFGQWGVFSALAGLGLWLAHEITVIASEGGPAALFTSALEPLWSACFLSAAAFVALAAIGRWLRRGAVPRLPTGK